jgi:hypothetical protein
MLWLEGFEIVWRDFVNLIKNMQRNQNCTPGVWSSLMGDLSGSMPPLQFL